MILESKQTPSPQPFRGEIGATICATLAGALALILIAGALHERDVNGGTLSPIFESVLTGFFQSLIVITVMVFITRAAQPPLYQLGRDNLAESRALVREVARLRGTVRDMIDVQANLEKKVDDARWQGYAVAIAGLAKRAEGNHNSHAVEPASSTIDLYLDDAAELFELGRKAERERQNWPPDEALN